MHKCLDPLETPQVLLGPARPLGFEDFYRSWERTAEVHGTNFTEKSHVAKDKFFPRVLPCALPLIFPLVLLLVALDGLVALLVLLLFFPWFLLFFVLVALVLLVPVTEPQHQ